MKTNVQITAVQKEFKNGQNGYEVLIDGLDGKLQNRMNFTDPLKAMRYMFLLSKRLELKIDNIQLTALSLAYQRAKEALQKVADDAISAAAEVGESEPEPEVAPQKKEEKAPEAKAPSSIEEQYNELKAKHPEALLLFRCGDFYEAYKQDAEDCAQILGITLTKRSNGGTSMAGFPYHALDTYLPKLIRAGKRVAICDQLQDPASKNLVKRGITDLVTPAENAPKRRGRKPAAEKQEEIRFNEEGAA